MTARSAEHRTAEDAVHTRWSNPGAHKLRLAEFPATPQALPDALEGLVIHVFVARSRGFQIPAGVEGDRYLRRTERLLDTALERDGRALIEPRDVPNRLFGNCHDFALLAVSRLRESSVPARLRVGFATYLAPGHWEDHWVCQHWTGTQWATLDAQLGPKSRSGLGISFDVSDLSDREWRSAASTWRAVRAGEVDPRLCGVSFAGLSGAWIVAKSVLLDAAAMAGIEMLPWDAWGPGRVFGRTREVTEDQARDVDALAAALDPAPNTRAEAAAVLDDFPWARPTPIVRTLSVQGTGVEIALDEA